MPKVTPFARRTDWRLASNELSLALEQLRKNKTRLLDLTESNPTKCAFEFSNKIITPFLSGKENASYVPSPRGLKKAREAICEYYKELGIHVSADQIFLTASTSEAYTNLFRLLIDPGGQVLFPRPSYPLFSFLGDLNDIHMDTYPLVYKTQWQINVDRMRHALNEDAKAIVLVNPNNPTGSFIQSGELDHINQLCHDRQLALICDEVFSDFAFDQKIQQLSLAKNDKVLTFVLGGISKTLGLPQMKLSWIIINGPKPLVQDASARLEVIADTYLSVNTPVQNALPQWLSQRAVIQKEIKERIFQNLNFLKKLVEGHDSCELLQAQGGWYAVLKIPNSCTEEHWALNFLKKDNVLVHPGYFYDFDSEAYIILSLLPVKPTFEEGARRIIKRVENHRE